MTTTTDYEALRTPLSNVLLGLGHHHFGWPHYFAANSLFWSMQRLFGHYHRIVSVADPFGIGENHGDTTFLDADIEGFIIRLRIVLNDVAFIVRQLYPQQVRYLKGPSGNVHPSDKEMSIHDLMKFHDEHPDFAPSIGAALSKNKGWIDERREQRDSVVHYKAQAVVFGDKAPYKFAMLFRSGAEKTEPTEGGGERVVTTDVFDFVHTQMRSLVRFMQEDLVAAIETYVRGAGMKYERLGIGDARSHGIGIELFNRVDERMRRDT